MKTFDKLDFLLVQIESKRNEMVLSAAKNGPSSEQTITKSKELDYLLNLHQRVTSGEKRVSSSIS